jgi:hypothetical protein
MNNRKIKRTVKIFGYASQGKIRTEETALW